MQTNQVCGDTDNIFFYFYLFSKIFNKLIFNNNSIYRLLNVILLITSKNHSDVSMRNSTRRLFLEMISK